MQRLLQQITTGTMCLALTLPPGMAIGQETIDIQRNATEGFPVCGTSVDATPLPCRVDTLVADNKREWRVLNIIRTGQAATVEEAIALIEQRQAERQAGATAGTQEATLPQCGDRATTTPLPCEMQGRVANTTDEWALLNLIRTGRASSMDEARQVLTQIQADNQANRAAETQAQQQADQAAEQRRQQAEQRERQLAEDLRRQQEAAAASGSTEGLPTCGPTIDNTPLPCTMVGLTAQDETGWRALKLIETGQASSVDEARAILADRQPGAQSPQVVQQIAGNLPQCGPRAVETPLPCVMEGRRVETREDWSIANYIRNGRASNEAEARRLLEQYQADRRAQVRAAAAANDAGSDTVEGPVRTVQQSDVRQADEDFDTRVTSTGEQSVQDDDGLSTFEQALLLGLGAVVVGSVLGNGDRVVSRTGDRLVVESPTGELRVLKDDNALLQQEGDRVRTQTYDDGSTRTIVEKPDGSRIITVRARDGSVLQRINEDPQGNRYVIIDDTTAEQEIIVSELPQVTDTVREASALGTEADLRRALAARIESDRSYSLRQVREVEQVRALAPQLELDAIRFRTGSAAIEPEQARALANIGLAMSDLIAEDPRTVILVEGHTDAVGDATYNLALSDRRAETVALALTQYFDVPPENMVTQGYGEAQLKVPTLEAEAANRRAVVRNITGLLR